VTTDVGRRYCGGSPLQLCIGHDDQCIDIIEDPATINTCRNSTDNCYDRLDECRTSNWTPFSACPAAAIPPGFDPHNDHPFVSHPDDWDTLFLKGANSFSVAAVRIAVWYDRGVPTNAIRTPVIVQRTFNPPASSTQDGIFDLSKYVKEKRQIDFEQHSGIGDGNFWSLPWYVREAAYDLHQAGMYKYDPFNRSRQQGCDECAVYMYENYSDARYYAHDLYENSPSLFSTGKLYTIDFETDPITGARTGVRGVYRCQNQNCSILDTIPYVPEIGDALIVRHSTGNGHVMMVVGPMITSDSPTSDLFEVPVLDLEGVVQLRTRRYSASERPFDEWYVVSINETNRPVVLSTGKNSSYTGFRVTQQALLFGTSY